MLVHAKKPEELNNEHVKGREPYCLLIRWKRKPGGTSTIRIVVIAGVIQAQSLSDDILGIYYWPETQRWLLRLSDNKYTGKGTPNWKSAFQQHTP
ncbi:hypothetical protein B0H13DRAFT_2371437 [Mycena leptocephala]|nr:hypothetical protein B0H13DRAFT_2371437 [Mycena leptocephala]